MQQKLFETNIDTKKDTNPQSLVISKEGKKVLTKNQQAFNKLTKKIEQLHRNIEKKQFQFDAALKLYATDFFPLKSKLAAGQRQLVTILWDVYKSYKLSKTDQRNLKKILQEHVQELCSHNEPDDKLKIIFKELEGESFESWVEKERDMMKAELEEMFDEMDIDIDLDGVDLTDDTAMAEKMIAIQQLLIDKQEKEQSQFEQRQKKKKLTEKQQENQRRKQNVDEMKQKNISSIYKQLAKLFHPDLERDPALKAEKEILMKELTVAYEAKNLHTLLMLELKWIHKETDHLENLSEEKLFVYLQILKEQIQELEMEADGMVYEPRYQVLVQEFGPTVQDFPLETVKDHFLELQNNDLIFKRNLEDFQSSQSLRHIRDMITEWRQLHSQQKIKDDFFNRP